MRRFVLRQRGGIGQPCTSLTFLCANAKRLERTAGLVIHLFRRPKWNNTIENRSSKQARREHDRAAQYGP